MKNPGRIKPYYYPTKDRRKQAAEIRNKILSHQAVKLETALVLQLT